MACSVLVCILGGGCSAGGIAGTGSALGYDCHDLQCACHQTECAARAVVASSSCNLGITGTGTPVMVLALAPVLVSVLILGVPGKVFPFHVRRSEFGGDHHWANHAIGAIDVAH